MRRLSDIRTIQDCRNELYMIEDSLIFSLIERSRYPQNLSIYEVNGPIIQDPGRSFLDFLLEKTEVAHAMARRYTAIDEIPYTNNLPQSLVPPIKYPRQIIFLSKEINYNPKLKEAYINKIIPELCLPGDDGNYGDSCVMDVGILQLISRRVHFGRIVAEVKYNDPKMKPQFNEYIKAKDRDALYKMIYYDDVVKQVMDRVRFKALCYTTEVDREGRSSNDKGIAERERVIQAVCDLYEKIMIPLTMDIEAEYLAQRRIDESE